MCVRRETSILRRLRLKEMYEASEIYLETMRSDTEQELASARQDNAAIMTELRAAREEVRESAASIDRLRADQKAALALSQQEYDLLEHKTTHNIQSLTSQVGILTERVQALTEERGELNRRVATLSSDHADKERAHESVSTELTYKTSELEIASKALVETRSQLASARAELVQSKATVATLEHEKEVAETAINASRIELNKTIATLRRGRANS